MLFDNVLMVGIEKIPPGAARAQGRGSWYKFNGDISCLSQCTIDDWLADQARGEWRSVRGAKVVGVHDITHYGGYDMRLGDSRFIQVFETNDRRRTVLLVLVPELEFELFMQHSRRRAKAPSPATAPAGRRTRSAATGARMSALAKSRRKPAIASC